MRRPVGVKSILDRLGWSLGFLLAELGPDAILPSASCYTTWTRWSIRIFSSYPSFFSRSSRESKQNGVWKDCRSLLRAGGRDMFHRGHLHVVRGLRHVLVFLHRFFLGNCRTSDFHLMADVWG